MVSGSCFSVESLFWYEELIAGFIESNSFSDEAFSSLRGIGDIFVLGTGCNVTFD